MVLCPSDAVDELEPPRVPQVADEGHQVQPQAEQRLSPQEVALAVLQTRC